MKRFWEKVNIGEPDECWEWEASKKGHGYGGFKLDGKIERVHRVAWELTNGPIPDGEGYHGTCVCHRCDNRLCCNPAHLFLGTHTDNMADAVRKGKFDSNGNSPGADNPMAKLTEDHVHLIRHCLELGCKQREIADVFGVSRSAIGKINTGKRWSHV